MIIGVGIDIVDIKRFSLLAEKKAFLKRVFSASELKYCMSKKNFNLHLAGRFAIKEAFIKAISDDKGFPLKKIETLNNSIGRPEITKNKMVAAVMKRKKINCIHVSIAHDKLSAVAVCILEG